MSAVTPSPTPEKSTSSSGQILTTEINTGAEIAAGVAAAIPGGQPVALGIGAAAAIADLVVHITSMYSQKVITAAQLTAMVKIAVSGFDSAVAAWDAAAPKNPTTA
ncbi:MAG: hypothetical protein VST70_01765 [Nitrospirota bacterium]|nr:hypothetical protein [Nitrospirota bacterium]